MSGASLTCYSPGATDARTAQASADNADGRWHCPGGACCKRQIVAVAPKSITTPTQPQTTPTTATLKSAKKTPEQQQTEQQQQPIQQQNTRPCNNSIGKIAMHRHRRANTVGASDCGPQASKRIKCKEDAPSGSLTSASPSSAQIVMMSPSDNTHMSRSPQLSNEQEQQQSQTELQSKKKDPTSHRLIEKRRRDRMNNCLSDLSKLIPAHYLKKGRGRVEKTEIIEMAIKHLKELHEFSDSSGSSCAGGGGVGGVGGQVQEKAAPAQADAVAGRCESPPSALQPPQAGLATMQSVWPPDSPSPPLAAHINGAVIQLQLHYRSMRQRAIAEVAAVMGRQQQQSPAASGANQHQQAQQLLPQHQQTQTQTQTSARTYHYQQRQAAAAAARKSYSQAAAAAAVVAALNCNAQNVGIRCNSLDSSGGSLASGMSSGLESSSSGSPPQSGNERSSSTSSTDSSSSGDISNELSSTATCLNNSHATVKLRNGNSSSSSVRETGDGGPDNVDDGNGLGLNSGASASVTASATNCLPIVQSMRHVVAAIGIIANAMKTVTEQVAAMLEAKSVASEDRLAALAESRRGLAINNAAFDAVPTLSTGFKKILLPHQQHQNQQQQQLQQQKQIIPSPSLSPCAPFANTNSNNSNIAASGHNNTTPTTNTTTGNNFTNGNNTNNNNSFNTNVNNNTNQNINNLSNNNANRNHPRPPIKLSLKRYEYCKQDSKPVQSKGQQC